MLPNSKNFIKKGNLIKNLFLLTTVVLFILVLLLTTNNEFSYWYRYLWMAPIAFVIALTVNTLGISGAAIFVPFFILVFPLLSGTTLETSNTVQLGLITESFGLSSSALAFWLFGTVDKKVALQSILVATPMIIVGVGISYFIPSSALYMMIALLLVIAGLMIVFENKLKANRKKSQKQNVDLSTKAGEKVKITSSDGRVFSYCRTTEGRKSRNIGFGIGGFFQGANGFGIGELGIVSMILSNIPTRIAIGTSHLIVASTAILASVIHFGLMFFEKGDVIGAFPWNIPIMTVPAVVIAGQIAPYIQSRVKARNLEKVIALLFVAISISLAVLALN